MQILRTVHELNQWIHQSQHDGKSLGFVPTMGYLHEGHLSLVRSARGNHESLGVSIFVNPTQFAPHEDLADYPRDEQRDLALLEQENVDWVFIPTVEEIYGPNFSTYVQPPKQAEGWCGASRPSHFRGVCTIVAILFNLVRPHRAYFGQKDAQQAAVIRQMVQDLHFPVEIEIGPIVREEDGLAMSSRNVYLTPEERQHALILSRTLCQGMHRFQAGENSAKAILAKGQQQIHSTPNVRIDYLGIVDQHSFASVDTIQPGNIYLGAVFIGKTRLIDNMIFKE